MANATQTLTNPDAPALHRVRALLVLLGSLIFRNDAAQRIDALFAEAEALLARHLLATALRQPGCAGMSPDDYDVRLVWRGGLLRFDVRRRPGALHPLQRAMVGVHRARLLSRYRLRLRLRSTRSRRFSANLASALRRGQQRLTGRASARARSTLHTPSRIAAPP